MPRGRKRARTLSPAKIAIAAAIAIVLIACIVLLILRPWKSKTPDLTEPQGEPSAVPTLSAEMTKEPDSIDNPETDELIAANPVDSVGNSVNTEPTDAPVPDLATPHPVDLTNAILPKIADGYLPVFEAAATEKKQIAITVDDMGKHDNVEKILTICEQSGAKITFFPVGQSVEDNPDLIKKIYDSGHEIENHTYGHINLYGLSTKEMVEQVVRQNLIINQALGVDYQMHFLRTRGGNALYDKRMHNMLQQMNYVGISHWNVSGTADMNTWASKLKDGDVLLFHCNDNDVAKLTKLIPKLTELGYELVTLNTLYNLPENETYPLGSTTIGSVSHLDLESMEADVPYNLLQRGDASYAVRRLQLRLKELGYYNNDCDGEYGTGTIKAVTDFQIAAGLDVDGIAGTKTQDALFSDDAPTAAAPAQ